MPRPANPKTPEGLAITGALAASGHTQAAVAERLDVSPGFISQFASGHRPVPWDKAELLAAVIGSEPHLVSAEYARLREHFQVSQPSRLNEAIVLNAIGVARKALGLAIGEKFDVEQAPDLFAQAIRVALAAEMRKEGGAVDGSGSGDGQAGGTDRFARPAKAGGKAEAGSGRKRRTA